MKISVIKAFRIALVLIATVIFLQTCGGCFPNNVNVNSTSSSGSIAIRIDGIPQPKSGTHYESMAINGNLTGNGSGDGRTSFNDTKTYEVTPTAINPAPSETKTAIKPGNWQVTVSSGTWSATGNGSVQSNGTRTFVFTFGSSNVNVQ